MQEHPISSPATLKGQSILASSGRTISALILREMGSTYGRSPGGYLWAVLEPIGAILLLSMAFSLLVRAPSLGTSFILFYATGYLPYQIYQKIENSLSSALTYSKALLAYPRVTWLDAVIARFVLNLLTTAMVFFLVVTGILLAIDSRTIIDMVPIVTGLVLVASLGMGVGLINAVLKGLFPVWKNVWVIASRPLFVASGLFFIYEDLPPLAQDILWWNPLFHGTGLVRTGFYPTYDAAYVSLPYCFGMGLSLTALGLLLMRVHYKKVLEN